MRPLLVTFAGGDLGSWAITRVEAVAGAPLEPASRLEVIEGEAAGRLAGVPEEVLRGVTSNERYVSRIEHDALVMKQESLGRSAATSAALIPITKSDVWWALAQDERRRIFEESSHHRRDRVGVPAGGRAPAGPRPRVSEPFDFLTPVRVRPRKRRRLRGARRAPARDGGVGLRRARDRHPAHPRGSTSLVTNTSAVGGLAIDASLCAPRR